MITIRNTQRAVPVNTKKIEQHARAMLHVLNYDDFDLGIWFTSNVMIQKYNAQYRHKSKPTDILSFPFHELKPGERIITKDPEEKNLGDLIISPRYVKDTLDQWGNSFEERLDILLAHGIAHLLGYDHEADEEYKEMQKVEKKLLRSLREIKYD